MINVVVSSDLPVDERLLVKKNCITSGNSGKRICIVTGTHGDELEGQYVCYRLAQLLKTKRHLLNGTVEIYPALNPLGIDSIMRGVLKGADMVIDIHSSNIFLREIPQVRININMAETLVPWARLLNVDFIWIHEAATVLESTLAHSLNATGTPCLVVEMGVGMRINHSYGNRLVEGILNLMNRMGMWKEEIDPFLISKPVVSAGDEVAFINAEASGVFLTEVKNNIIVEEGEEIGCIVSSLTGNVLQRVTAASKGLLFTLRAYPIVYEGSLIARIHQL